MNVTILAAAFAALTVSASFGAPSLTRAFAVPESRFTDLSADTCLPETGAAADALRLRCPGLGGARVVVSGTGERSAIGFAWSSREVASDVVEAAPAGLALEWRGVGTGRGFDPYAVMVRVSDPGRVSPFRTAVAVIRLRPGEACLVGLVRPAPGLDLQEEARRVADGDARREACRPSGHGAVADGGRRAIGS